MDMHKMLDPGGRPTAEVLRVVDRVRRALDAVILGHYDNTGAICRVDLDDHDCCITCNLAAAALAGALQGEPEIAAGECE